MIVLRNKQFANVTPALANVKVNGGAGTYLNNVTKRWGMDTKRGIGARRANSSVRTGSTQLPQKPTIGNMENLINERANTFLKENPQWLKPYSG